VIVAAYPNSRVLVETDWLVSHLNDQNIVVDRLARASRSTRGVGGGVAP
ncbi:hypothetical protein LCGC14_2742010, partial [marine sediment metagenome]